jgi:hypothetical protein
MKKERKTMFNKKMWRFLRLLLLTGFMVGCAQVVGVEVRRTVTISDMSICKPSSALLNIAKKKHWTLIPYETEEGSGVMIGAGSMADAPDITLPLRVKGWYAIYLAYWNPHHDYDGDTLVKLKLTGDPCFRNISERNYHGVEAAPMMWDRAELKECFVRDADLTDRELTFGQHTKSLPRKSYIAYIKLVPLNELQVDLIKKDRANKDTRILTAANDGISFLSSKGCTTREDILEQLELYRHSDVGKVMWAFTYGDRTNYPTKVGSFLASETSAEELTMYSGEKQWRQSLETLTSKGIVPSQVALEHVHDMGLEFHAMFRMAMNGDIFPAADGRDANLITTRRPELRMVTKDGTALEKASYAFPEVQDHMLALIREVAENFDIDGVNLGFIRGPQFVAYEKPVIEDFKKEYGEDPRNLDDNDIRIQRLRARYMTDFVRKARKLIDEIETKKGRKIELSAWVYKPERDLFYGLDTMTWVKEGLVDSIVSFGTKEYVNTVKENNCKFYQPGGGFFKDLVPGYEKGIDGFVVWDINLHYQELPEPWAIFSKAGHKEVIKAFEKNPPKLKTIKLKTVGGKDISHPTNVGANERGFWPPEMISVYSGG